MGVGIVRVKSQDGVRLRLGLIGLFAGEQDVAQVDARLKIARLQVDRAQASPDRPPSSIPA